MRINNSLKNATIGLTFQAVVLLLGFVSRRIFINFLGEEYLGLNGLFSNVISLLSMAELGIATSITYSLYIPLAKNDNLFITKLMSFYKTCYRIIAGVILIFGMATFPFIGGIVGETTINDNYIQAAYLLFLLTSVSTYFFSYKRSIVYADQKDYKVMYLDMLFKVGSFIITTATLFLFKDYLFYLASIMLIGICNNYVVAQYVDKLYPFLKSNDLRLDKHEMKPIIANTKNIFIHKLAGTVISSTDNIIIATFLGIIQVGLYSNYSLIITSLQGIMSKLLNSCQPSIGNLLAVEAQKKVEETLQNMTFLSFLITSISTVSLLCLANDFIMLWLGERFLLETPFVAMCAINFFTSNIKNPLYQFVNVSGLFKEDRNNAIIGAVLNIALSLAFVKLWGIFGIILGAFLASLATLVLKTNFFYKKYLHKSSIGFLRKTLLFFTAGFFELIFCYYLCSFIYTPNLMVTFVLKGVICVFCPAIINIILFYNSSEFKYLTSLCVTVGTNYLKVKNA